MCFSSIRGRLFIPTIFSPYFVTMTLVLKFKKSIEIGNHLIFMLFEMIIRLENCPFNVISCMIIFL
jgi:hypothetical protein